MSEVNQTSVTCFVNVTHIPAGKLIFTANVPKEKSRKENKVLRQFIFKNNYIREYLNTNMHAKKRDIVKELFEEIVKRGHIEVYSSTINSPLEPNLLYELDTNELTEKGKELYELLFIFIRNKASYWKSQENRKRSTVSTSKISKRKIQNIERSEDIHPLQTTTTVEESVITKKPRIMKQVTTMKDKLNNIPEHEEGVMTIGTNSNTVARMDIHTDDTSFTNLENNKKNMGRTIKKMIKKQVTTMEDKLNTIPEHEEGVMTIGTNTNTVARMATDAADISFINLQNEYDSDTPRYLFEMLSGSYIRELHCPPRVHVEEEFKRLIVARSNICYRTVQCEDIKFVRSTHLVNRNTTIGQSSIDKLIAKNDDARYNYISNEIIDSFIIINERYVFQFSFNQ